MIIHEPRTPTPDEPCRASYDGGPGRGYYSTPGNIIDRYDGRVGIYIDDGRLVGAVRRLADVARGDDGHVEVLVEAALRLVAQRGIVSSSSSTPPELYTADFAVSGRSAYERFRRSPPTDAGLVARVRAAIPSRGASFGIDPSEATDEVIERSVAAVLDRAYRVAWALRGNPGQRAALRRDLRWIGVSGEDDTPDRPVNVPSAPFPQYDLDVDVNGHPVRARFMLASPGEEDWPEDVDERGLPPEPDPYIPDDHEIIVFLHGHSSRLEEALDLVPHLHSEGLARGKRYTVLAVDLPGAGYTRVPDHQEILPVMASRYNHPALRFLEDFVVAFLRTLDGRMRVLDRVAAVIGGSLGGNLCLRLGRWAGRPEEWLRTICAWSAASLWSSVLDYEIYDIGGLLRRESFDVTLGRAKEEETDRSRRDYFSRVFVETTDILFVNVLRPQPEYWYRDDWQPCKNLDIARARADRQEIYSAAFRRWHWRIANEQLAFSHRDPYTRGGHRSYELIHARTLLAAGAEDNHTGAHIYDRTRDMARFMRHTNGEALFLLDTGHSIHSERPAYFAREIVRFLNVRGCSPLPDWAIRRIIEGLGRG